jgi:hypothetical protein
MLQKSGQGFNVSENCYKSAIGRFIVSILTPLQKRTAEMPRARSFPAVVLCVRCASAVTRPFDRRLNPDQLYSKR